MRAPPGMTRHVIDVEALTEQRTGTTTNCAPLHTGTWHLPSSARDGAAVEPRRGREEADMPKEEVDDSKQLAAAWKAVIDVLKDISRESRIRVIASLIVFFEIESEIVRRVGR